MSCLRVMWYNTLWFLVVTPWWYHDVETLSTLLVCVWGRWTSLTKGLLIRASDIYLAVSINKLWNKQSTHHWFQTPGRSYHCNVFRSWWRHQMEFSALLAICAGNSPATGEFPHKGQWRGALMFSLICTWNGWVNNRAAGDLRRHRAHYDVTVMWITGSGLVFICSSIDLSCVRCQAINCWTVQLRCLKSQVTSLQRVAGVCEYHIIMTKLMMTSSNGKFSALLALCAIHSISIGDRWIPLTKASDWELWCSLWFAPEQTVE